MPAHQEYEEFLRPIVTGWLGKIEAAIRAKKEFNDTAEQCMSFFSAATGFIWEPKFRNRYLGGNLAPRFKVTMSKAFELVALFGPVLYWRNPQRYIKQRPQIDLTPELFGVTPQTLQMLQQHQQAMQQFQQAQAQASQNGQQNGQPPSQPPPPPQIDPGQQFSLSLFQQAQNERQQMDSRDKARNAIMETYLNYSPIEQPGGGLARHSELAITEALVKGRGCLWIEPYVMPESDKILTGGFYDSVDNLLIDPDCEDPTLRDAKWIARRRCKPVWQVEDEHNLPRGTLETKGQMESSEHIVTHQQPNDRMYRAHGKTFDLMVYYEVWSKGGVGGKLQGVNTPLSEEMEDVVGDYAYLVIAPNVPYPLNAPSREILDADNDKVQEMFEWPVPFWRDDRWPVAVLDFYYKPRSVWPLAPMAQGLGELIFLNVMMSHLANRIYSSSRDFIAVLKSASSEIEETIKNGEDQAIIRLNEVHGDIRRVIQFLQQPQVNMDVWKIIDAVSEQFAKRVGLTELVYGLNPGGVQSRSAADITAKQENLSVRPDHMSQKVEEWQATVADLEKFTAFWYVEGQDLQYLLGPTIAMALWPKLVTQQDPELVMREMRATVQAGSARKPNKMRDSQNLQAIMPQMFPELSKHADVTFDTNPLNALIERIADVQDMDLNDLKMGPRQPQPPPPPPPEVQQQMQMQAQMELAKLQAEVQKLQLEAQVKQADIGTKQAAMQAKQIEARVKALQARMEQQKAQTDIQATQAKTQADIQSTLAKSKIETEKGRQDIQSDSMRRGMEIAFDQLRSDQEIRQDQTEHLQEIRQSSDVHEQKMQQEAELHRQRIRLQEKLKKAQASNAKKQQSR